MIKQFYTLHSYGKLDLARKKNDFCKFCIFCAGVCPVLCSQRGEYINGECQCNPGWKGKECSLRHDECEVPDCNGHGHCVSGKCQCVRGYKGKFCEEGMCEYIFYMYNKIFQPLFFIIYTIKIEHKIHIYL